MINFNDEFFVFEDTAQYVFKTDIQINDTWLFDSINNITVEFFDATYESVLGNMDSVKYFILTTGDTIKLSKNYGIVQFQVPFSSLDYKLIGIENLGIGFQVPNYMDFYDYNIGDIFEYYNRDIDQDGYIKTLRHIKYKVLSKQSITNGYSYEMERLEVDSAFLSPSFYLIHYFHDTVVSNFSEPESFLDYYNHQKYMWSTSKYTRIDFANNSTFNCKTKKYNKNIMVPRYEEAEYGESIGLIYYHWYNYDLFYHEAHNIYKALLGCNIDGTIRGTIHDDPYFVAPQNALSEINSSHFKVYPNPAKGNIVISSENEITDRPFSLVNIFGNTVINGIIMSPNSFIDVSGLSPGIYYLSIDMGDAIVRYPISKL